MSPETKTFVSHAWEDKEDFVREFAERLRELCRVWYDEYSLPFGASIFGSISAGLRDCDFGVVVLSQKFFEKAWTQNEIAGLFALEAAGRCKIIPLWKGVTREQVAHFSPILADRLGIDCSRGVDHAVECFVRAVGEINQTSGYSTPAQAMRRPEDLLAQLGERLSRHQATIAMNASPDAQQKVRDAQTALFGDAEARIQQVALTSPAFGLTWSSGSFHCLPNDIKWLNVTLPNQDILRLETTLPRHDIDRLRLDLKVFRPQHDEHGQYTYPVRLEEHQFAPRIDHSGSVEWRKEGGDGVSSAQIIDLMLSALLRQLEPLVDRVTDS